MQLEVHTVDAEALGEREAGLDDLHAGRVDAIVVRGVYAPREMAAIVQRLEAGVPGFQRLPMGDQFEAYSMGHGLDRSERESYLASVASFCDAANALFADAGNLDRRFSEVLGALAGDRTVRRPDDAGRPYMPFDIRCLPPGGTIPPHIELEQLGRPPYRHLKPMLDGVTLLSFYLTLQAAESGGALVVHDIGWNDVDETLMRDDHTQLDTLAAQRDRQALTQQAGDLIVFDGGRIAHHVAPVEGRLSRWTAGGFMSLCASRDHWWRWA